jgi:hypothetical protein
LTYQRMMSGRDYCTGGAGRVHAQRARWFVAFGGVQFTVSVCRMHATTRERPRPKEAPLSGSLSLTRLVYLPPLTRPVRRIGLARLPACGQHTGTPSSVWYGALVIPSCTHVLRSILVRCPCALWCCSIRSITIYYDSL